MSIRGNVAIITGASSGIGSAIAQKIAEFGINLALIARRIGKLNTLASDLRELGITVHTYQCDVSSEQQVINTFASIARDFENIDFLINNAGVSSSAPLEEMNQGVKAINEDYAVNVRGTFMCTVAAYPLIKRGGAIVNISSIRARTGTPSSSIGYAAAKAAVINITKSFAQQLAKYNIRVNCIAPGAIFPTEMSENWSMEKRKAIAESCPLKRLGTPQDIANVAYFFISDFSSYITGHTIDVNGGRWMN